METKGKKYWGEREKVERQGEKKWRDTERETERQTKGSLDSIELACVFECEVQCVCV